MGIHINSGHVPEDGGKRWKHLNLYCPELQQRAVDGYPIRQNVRNPDGNPKKPLSEHAYRRCPVCFQEGGSLGKLPVPASFLRARKLQKAQAAHTRWTYNIHDPVRKHAQVGMASDLFQRLSSRWRATCKTRFGQDCIPWLYDCLTDDPRYEPALDVEAFETEREALLAEDALRRQLQRDGWHVTSMV